MQIYENRRFRLEQSVSEFSENYQITDQAYKKDKKMANLQKKGYGKKSTGSNSLISDPENASKIPEVAGNELI